MTHFSYHEYAQNKCAPTGTAEGTSPMAKNGVRLVFPVPPERTIVKVIAKLLLSQLR